MSIIDTLVIELDLDPSKMSKGARESIRTLRQMETASDKTAKVTSDGWDKAGDAFAKTRREFISMLAVFTAGRSIKAFASDVMNLNSELGYTAKQLDMSAQTLAKLEARSQAAGGTHGEVAASFANMQAKLTDPQAASSQALAFSALGVADFKDANGNIATNIIDRLHDAQQRQHMDAATLKRWLSIAGVTGEGQLREIQMDDKAFADNKRFGDTFPVPSDKDIAQYQALQAHIAMLQLHAEALAQKGLAKITPELDHIVTTIDKWIQENGPLATGIAGVTAALVSLIAVMAALKMRSFVGDLLALPGAIKAAQAAAEEAKAGGVMAAEVTAKAAPKLGLLAKLGMVPFAEISAGLAITSEANSAEHDAAEAFNARRDRVARAQQAIKAFEGAGYSREAALGITANLYRESGFYAGARGDRNKFGMPTAFGLMQWHQDRVDDILKHTGIDVRTAAYGDQLKAVLYEMQSGGDAGTRKAARLLRHPNATTYGATAVFTKLAERPASDAETMIRYGLAQQIDRQTRANQSTFNVGDIHVHTNTNDPKQLAHGLKQALTQMQAQHESRSVVQ
ncbi:phage tail tip lysozyme [Brytella acorum]|uniref:phage tail tip lysozyme n=1 Tax=Brytella acorum TaxID=2959299 RepID=UPI0025AEA842|nr:phage tail tip lysozyme [Brytella acorum]MDF3625782.1 phage tail tip lysozyme [Brytella acorum]